MKKKAQGEAKRKPAALYREPVRNEFLAVEYGLEPFAALLLAYADEDREPRDGERVFLHYARDGMGCGCIGTGVYRSEGGRRVVERYDDREPLELDGRYSKRHYLMRVVGYVRDDNAAVWFDPEDARKWAGASTQKLRESELLMTEEEYVAEFGQTWEEHHGFIYTRDEKGRPLPPPTQPDEVKAQIARLKARLTRLSETDEITTCSARFNLEKQIYDLEHPVDLDDWSAWEEGGAR